MPDPQSLAKGLMADGPVMRAYEPSWRDRMAAALMGDGRASPARAQVVMGLMGSRGLGSTGLSAVDATPAGAVLDMQQAAQHGDRAGMAMAAAGFVPGAKVAEKVAAKVAEVAPAASKGIIAYHGSPHSFDKFDMSKIGTGEGAQAYGHGLYFADNEKVAREYQKALAGKDIIPAINAEMSRLAKIMDQHEIPGKWRQFRSPEGYEAAKRYDELMYARANEKGHMYQVRINADPEHFLDWDKPLSGQPKNVQTALKDMKPEWTGGQVLESSRLVSGDYFDRAAASQALQGRGIPGIKYLDQGSRGTSGGELFDVFQGPNGWQSRIKVSGRGGAGFLTPTDSVTTSKPFASEADARAWADSKINSGSRNYVVFDDKIIEIMRKYGLVGSAGAAMAAEILQRQNGGQPQGQAAAPVM